MPNIHTRKAFSFPETLLAIFLIASLILYFLAAFGVGKNASQLSKERLIVINLLREDMEFILGSNYSTIDSLAGSQNITINDGLKSFQATKTLGISTEDAGIYGYKKVYDKIEWVGGARRNRVLNEEMVLYVTKK